MKGYDKLLQQLSLIEVWSDSIPGWSVAECFANIQNCVAKIRNILVEDQIEEQKKERKENMYSWDNVVYPCIGFLENWRVKVIFVKDGCGTVLDAGSAKTYSKGYYSESWDMPQFKPLPNETSFKEAKKQYSSVLQETIDKLSTGIKLSEKEIVDIVANYGLSCVMDSSLRKEATQILGC